MREASGRRVGRSGGSAGVLTGPVDIGPGNTRPGDTAGEGSSPASDPAVATPPSDLGPARPTSGIRFVPESELPVAATPRRPARRRPAAPPIPATGLRIRTPDGARAGSIVVEPEDAVPGLPTVVVYHGSNQRGTSLRAATRGSFDRLAELRLARVVYPSKHPNFWHPGRGVDDVAELRDTVAFAGTGQVIAVGYSDGGFFVSRLLHEAPELLAGAVLLNATQLVARAVPGPVAHPVPVLLVAGTADPIVPYAGGTTSSWGVQRRGEGMSLPATAAYFAGRNGIRAAPLTDRMPHHPRSQGTWVERTSWRESSRAPVELLTVHGGGHLVPSGALPLLRWPLGRSTLDVVAADEVAAFFGLGAR